MTDAIPGSDSVQLLLEAARPLIELAVAEDIGPGDATSQSTLPPGTVLRGRITAKAPGVVAGLPVAEAVFRRIDPALVFTAHVLDGQEVTPGDAVADVTGPGTALLSGERIALNFLQRMSGIATLTRQFVDALAPFHARILDTRKTLPGHRTLDKYAVRCGGGDNHRTGLFDMLMVKDNHIDGAGGITAAVARARAAHPELPIEVEVKDLDELHEALAIDPPLDRIMLDNMSLEAMRQAVDLTAGRVPLEASGNVTLARLPAIAATGVDFISSGALTHSVTALDLSMRIERQPGTPHASHLPSHASRISALKQQISPDLVILGHHYQRDEVIRHADFTGDSLQLSQDAARTTARFIVFCGVHFMAETAAILARPGQHVLIPDPTAGCYLADTATLADVQAAWEALGGTMDVEASVTPITYVNSTADLKAFCGRHNGVVCTSGNAEQVLRWALERRPKVFFFPDQHLGRNTARRLGLDLDQIALWDPRRPAESAAAARDARVVLWPGCCNVHMRFRPEHADAVRARYPGIRVIVHPECPMEVVERADAAASTAGIIRQVEAAPAGTRWAVGTETNLVQRLKREHPQQFIVSLADVPPFCRSMAQISEDGLLAVLSALAEGRLVNEVRVEAGVAREARVALQRMLDLSRPAEPPVAPPA